MRELSQREEMVLRLIWEGMSYKEIAMALDIEECTVQTIRVNLTRKLGGGNNVRVVRRALGKGLIQV